MGHDGFTLDDNYDAAEEYTRSTNKKGFGETVYVKLPPEIAGEIGALVASRQVPALRTTADAIRSAIVHRLHWWATNLDDHKIERTVQTEMALCRTERYIDEMKALEGHLAKLKEAGHLAQQSADWSMLAALILEARETSRHIRDPYATRLATEADKFLAWLPTVWREQIDDPDRHDGIYAATDGIGRG